MNSPEEPIKPLYCEELPDLRRIGESMMEILPFLVFCPWPSKSYAEMHGWTVNADGTIGTSGGWTVPSRELCEEKELEKLYEVSDLEHLMKLEDTRDGSAT